MKPLADEEIREKLATCARMLNKLGLFNIFGHVSARVPGKEQFYITATLGSVSKDEEFTTEGLVLCDYTGRKLSGNGTVPLEVVIHSALHKGREDAACVVHVHPFYSMTLAIAGIPFRPVNLQGAPLGGKVPVYRRSELLINENHGRKLIRAIGKAKAILLRGHGVVTVGATVEEAFFLTVYLEDNCRTLLEASKAGEKVIYLTRPEIKEWVDKVTAEAEARGGNPYKRIFNLWLRGIE